MTYSLSGNFIQVQQSVNRGEMVVVVRKLQHAVSSELLDKLCEGNLEVCDESRRNKRGFQSGDDDSRVRVSDK